MGRHKKNLRIRSILVRIQFQNMNVVKKLEVVKKADEISAKADQLVSEASIQVVETADKISDEITD